MKSTEIPTSDKVTGSTENWFAVYINIEGNAEFLW